MISNVHHASFLLDDIIVNRHVPIDYTDNNIINSNMPTPAEL